VCGFLIAFHSNYDTILYCLLDIVTYWSMQKKIIPHLYLSTPQGMTPSEFRDDVRYSNN